MRARIPAVALVALCLSASAYCFADENAAPTCTGSDDGTGTCSYETGDLYEVLPRPLRARAAAARRRQGACARRHRGSSGGRGALQGRCCGAWAAFHAARRAARARRGSSTARASRTARASTFTPGARRTRAPL